MASSAPAHERLVCAVMAGGSGTRFWPLSRRETPKQLLSFFGKDTLLRATIDRVAPLCPPERRLVITAAHLCAAVQTELPELAAHQIIGEPAPRNTAPCMALAAVVAAQIDPDAILVLLPADHFVADAEGFRQALVRAATEADAGFIATLGVTPTSPETGYGYIEIGAQSSPGTYAVDRFVEKPDLDTAVGYLVGQRHLWNAGVFVLRADVALRAIRAHVPAILEVLAPLCHGLFGYDDPAFGAILQLQFPLCPSVSIDYGVMEHERDLRVVRLDAGWSDVGTWQSVLGLRAADQRNFTAGDVTAVDCTDCVLVSHGPALTALGLRDVAVVATAQATLVLPLDRSQDVRLVVDQLKAKGRADLL